VKGLLNRPINWSSPHIGPGKKWGEVVREIKDPTTQG
jgi:hypothetical protein